MAKMNEEALRRIKQGGQAKEHVKTRKAPVSYKSPGQLPRESEVRQLKIYVGKLAWSLSINPPSALTLKIFV